MMNNKYKTKKRNNKYKTKKRNNKYKTKKRNKGKSKKKKQKGGSGGQPERGEAPAAREDRRGEGDHGVGAVGLVHHLDAVGDQVARAQRVAHRLHALRLAVRHDRRAEDHGLAAGLIDEDELHEIECCSIPGSGAW